MKLPTLPNLVRRVFAVIALAAACQTSVLHAQLEITSYTIDAGGGTSTSSTGEFSLTGSIGQPDASIPILDEIFFLSPGFWNSEEASPPLTGYAAWAAANIPGGKDRSFDADADGDGLANGVNYVFGDTKINPLGGNVQGTGRIAAPPSIPDDVNVILEIRTPTVGVPLQDWTALIAWLNGNEPFFASPGFTSIESGIVVDTFNLEPFFYRYRITLR